MFEHKIYKIAWFHFLSYVIKDEETFIFLLEKTETIFYGSQSLIEQTSTIVYLLYIYVWNCLWEFKTKLQLWEIHSLFYCFWQIKMSFAEKSFLDYYKIFMWLKVFIVLKFHNLLEWHKKWSLQMTYNAFFISRILCTFLMICNENGHW